MEEGGRGLFCKHFMCKGSRVVTSPFKDIVALKMYVPKQLVHVDQFDQGVPTV